MAKHGLSWWEIVLLTVLAILAYGATLTHPFVFDDLGGIVENRAIRSLWPPWAVANSPQDTTPFGRPIVAFSLAVNHLIGGLNPASYHVFNIALHVLTGCVLLLLGRELLKISSNPAIPKFFPLLVVGIWIVHPLCTSAVTYIIQRAEVWMALFYTSTLYFTATFCQAGGNPARRKLWIASVLCCIGGMLSKESMVTAPLAALFLDRAFFASTWKELWEKRKFFHASLASTWLVLAVCMVIWPRSRSVGFHEDSLGSWNYLLMQSEVIMHYLRLLVWPIGLSLDYAWPPVQSFRHVLPEILVLAGIGTSVVVLWFKNPKLAWMLGIPFLILAPTSSVVPVITAIASEHRMYLPSVFLISTLLLGVVGTSNLLRIPPRFVAQAITFISVALVVVLLQLTVQRNRVYDSVESVWRDVVIKQPNNSRAWNNLGLAVWNESRPAEAEKYFRLSIEKDSRNADAHYNLGTILGRRGEHAAGLESLQRAIEIWPDYAAAYANMGVIYYMTGETQKGFEAYQQALKFRPDHLVANFNMAVIRFQRGELDEAYRHVRTVVTIQPNYPRAQELLRDITTSKAQTQPAFNSW